MPTEARPIEGGWDKDRPLFKQNLLPNITLHLVKKIGRIAYATGTANRVHDSVSYLGQA